MWNCLCDCGNRSIVGSSNLKSGHIKSCGCLVAENNHNRLFEDLTGHKFNRLTVLYRNTERKGTIWHCKCECGNEIDVNLGNLKRGHSLSYGCNKIYKLEFLVNQYLQENDYAITIDYKTQIRFDDLRGVGNKPLSYDFGIYKYNKLVKLIECQGKQHFEPVEHFGGEEQLQVQKKHDLFKREYANNIGIELIEIPYTIKNYIEMAEYLSEYDL